MKLATDRGRGASTSPGPRSRRDLSPPAHPDLCCAVSEHRLGVVPRVRRPRACCSPLGRAAQRSAAVPRDSLRDCSAPARRRLARPDHRAAERRTRPVRSRPAAGRGHPWPQDGFMPVPDAAKAMGVNEARTIAMVRAGSLEADGRKVRPVIVSVLAVRDELVNAQGTTCEGCGRPITVIRLGRVSPTVLPLAAWSSSADGGDRPRG
jgi:hypothetical protein